MCYGPYNKGLHKGLPANKQTLSRWIVDAITTKYVSSDLPSPRGSGLILLEVWGPPRPFHLVYQCTLFVTPRDGPPI